jgi:hypothetical protein
MQSKPTTGNEFTQDSVEGVRRLLAHGLKSGGVKRSLHGGKFAYGIDDINQIQNNKPAKR